MHAEAKEAAVSQSTIGVKGMLQLDELRKLVTDGEIETVVESTTREVAAWIEERLIQEQQPPPSNRAECPRCVAVCA